MGEVDGDEEERVEHPEWGCRRGFAVLGRCGCLGCRTL